MKQSTIYFEKEESFISFFVSSGFQDQKMTREKSPKSIRHERMHRPLCKFEIQYTNRVGRGPTFWFLEIILAHFLFCFSSTCSFIHHGWLAIFLPSLNCSSCAYRLLGIPALSFFFPWISRTAPHKNLSTYNTDFSRTEEFYQSNLMQRFDCLDLKIVAQFWREEKIEPSAPGGSLR